MIEMLEDPNPKPNVVITVSGGIAHVKWCDPGLLVQIEDHDIEPKTIGE